jgi:hypothetical protein
MECNMIFQLKIPLGFFYSVFDMCLTHFFQNSEELVPSIPAGDYGGNRPSETLC